jgi:hypothetical protein
MNELRARTLGCLLLLGFFADLYAEIANSERSSHPNLALIADFEGDCSPIAFHAMQAELATILQPAGVIADWHSLKQVTGSQTFTELVVARFKGSCEIDQQISAADSSRPLGLAHVSDGEILPFVEIHCGHIYEVIRHDVRGDGAQRKATRFGQAIARVVAHELYHVLSNSVRHTKAGITKAMYTSADLLASHLGFEPQQGDMIRISLLHPQLPAARPSTVALTDRLSQKTAFKTQ